MQVKILTLLLYFLISLFVVPPAFSYKVEKPEQLSDTPPREDIFQDKWAPKEATLISIGEQGLTKEAYAGDTIYLAQTFKMYPGYRLKEKVDELMPGTFKVPFKFWINSGDLFFRNEDTYYHYFAPKHGNTGAYFPGAKEVMSGNDTAGVRRHKKTGRLEWYVDNSNFNNRGSGRTIWKRRVTSKEMPLLDYVEEGLPYKTLGLKKIIYEGFYDNTFIFTLIRESNNYRAEKEYRFDADASGETTVLLSGVSIKCLQIDNQGMTYKLINISEH